MVEGNFQVLEGSAYGLAPLGNRDSAAFRVGLTSNEVTLEAEVNMHAAVDQGELLQRLHLLEPQHR